MADNRQPYTLNAVLLILRKLIASQFLRAVATVASGAAGAQLVAVALTPLITRLYGPEAFGQLGVFHSAIAILAPAAALTYPIAIVLPKADAEAHQLIRLSASIALIYSLSLYILLTVFHGPIVHLLDLQTISEYLYYLPLVVFFMAGRQIFEQWLIRKQLYAPMARANILQSLLVRGLQTLAGLKHPVGGVLIGIASGGYLLHTVMLAYIGRRSLAVRDEGLGHRVSGNLSELAHRYRDFPLLRAPEVIINAASVSLPVVLVAAFYGPSIAGFYTLSRTVLSLPTQLIGKSVGDVFYPRVAEAAHSGQGILRLLKRSTLALLAVGALPYAILVIFGPFLFASIFGNEWRTAGQFVQLIAMGSLLHLVNRPAVHAMPVLSAQGLHLAFTVGALVMRAGGIMLGYFAYDNAIASIALYGLADAVFNLVRVLVVVRLSKAFDSGRTASSRFKGPD